MLILASNKDLLLGLTGKYLEKWKCIHFAWQIKTSNEMTHKHFAEKNISSKWGKSETDRERRKSISYKDGLNTTICLSENKLKETNYLKGVK